MLTLSPSILTPLIIFIVSGIGIVSIVGIKMYQQSSGAILPLIARRNTVEGKVKQVRKSGIEQLNNLGDAFRIKTLAIIFSALRATISHLATRFKTAMVTPEHWLDKRTRSLVSLIRGRQESQLKQRGKPSEYMRKIASSETSSTTSSKNDKKSV